MTRSIRETSDLRSGRVARPMGAQERLLYLYSKEHHRHFCLVGDIAGTFGPIELGIALQKVQMRHPHLWFAIQDDEDGPHFIEHNRLIQVEMCEAEGENGWRRTVEAELARPFDPWVGPLLRVAVVQSASDVRRVSVVLTFHHAIADGLSGVAFLSDLVSALNGNELPPAARRPSVEKLVLSKLGGQSNFDEQPLMDKATIEHFAAQPLWRPFEGDIPRISSASLDRGQTDSLVATSRKHGTTVHGALCAALALANARLQLSDSYSILSPINIRSMAEVDPSEVGLFVSVTVTRQPLPRRPRFWELAKSYTAALSQMRSEDNVIRTMRGLEGTLPRMAPAHVAWALVGSRGYDAVVSNLGAIGAQPFGEIANLEAVWGPMVLGRIKNERMIGAATLNGALRLTEARPVHLPESLKRAVELLVEASGYEA